MRIYIDSNLENKSCKIWFEDGNIQILKGDITDICNRIGSYVLDNESKIDGVYVNHLGFGATYVDTLQRLGLDVKVCSYNKLIK